MLTAAAAFLYAAAPMPPAWQTSDSVSVPGFASVAAADDDGDDDDDEGDDRGDYGGDDDDGGDDGGDDGDGGVRWVRPHPDRAPLGVQGRTGRSSRRGERPRRKADEGADTAGRARGAESGPVGGDDVTVTRQSDECEDCEALETKMGVPSTRDGSTRGQRQRALIALTAIAGTAAILGAVYWLVTRLDLRDPLPSPRHPFSDAAAGKGDADRPPAFRSKVTFDRAQRSEARWRRSPGERRPP
ncbi:hypothetical protein GCM10022224_052680 [Nonomuraea antimicrobica]|uniref:Serine/threonine protein kinase n=1 Tax=Nonomuraea antimicrobica TaxID=561173 RepID=A0ABP7CA65_9ACTN